MNFRAPALIIIFYRALWYNLSVYTMHIYMLRYTTSVDKSHGGGFTTTTTVLYYYLGVGIQYIYIVRSISEPPPRGGDGLLSCPAEPRPFVFSPTLRCAPRGCCYRKQLGNIYVYMYIDLRSRDGAGEGFFKKKKKKKTYCAILKYSYTRAREGVCAQWKNQRRPSRARIMQWR